MPRLPVGSPARPRSDRWWCRYFAELVWVDELARAPVRSGLRRRTPESGEQSMIVSTWQFLQKQVRGGSLERVAKGVNHGKDPAQINFLSPFASTSFVCFEPGHCSCVIRLVRRSARRRLSIRGDRDSPIFRIAPTSWGCLRTGSIAVQLCRELRSALSVEQGRNGNTSRSGNVPRGQLPERNQFLRASPLSRCHSKNGLVHVATYPAGHAGRNHFQNERHVRSRRNLYRC